VSHARRAPRQRGPPPPISLFSFLFVTRSQFTGTPLSGTTLTEQTSNIGTANRVTANIVNHNCDAALSQRP
jgi:hypothetical protein